MSRRGRRGKKRGKVSCPFRDALETMSLTQETDTFATTLNDISAVRKRMKEILSSSEEKRSTFLESMNNYIGDDRNCMLRCLRPIQFRKKICGERNDAEGVAEAVATCRLEKQSESLMRALLQIRAMQSDVVRFLLCKIPEFMDDESNESSENANDSRVGGSASNIPRLLIHQIRWLPLVIDGDAMVTQVLECMVSCPRQIQREIVASLPEIVDETHQWQVVEALQELIQSDTSMTVVAFDCFSQLDLTPGLAETVTSLALESLSSVSMDHLPVILRFLLQRCVASRTSSVVDAIRESIEMVRKPNEEDFAQEALLLEALGSGLYYREDVAAALLEKLKTSTNDMPMDLYVILVLHGRSKWTRVAAKTFQRKVCRNVDTGETTTRVADWLTRAICDHGKSLRNHYSSLLDLVEGLLLSRVSSAHCMGRLLYPLLFNEFQDSSQRQMLVGKLITHTGSGNAMEVDAALEALVTLADMPRDLLPFAVFVKGTLDFVLGLSLSQIRRVYDVICALTMHAHHMTRCDTSETDSELDELMILLQKHLAKDHCISGMSYKLIGIIGVVALVRRVAINDAAEEARMSGSTKSDNIDDDDDDCEWPNAGTIQPILDRVVRFCRGAPSARAFFYDEVADAIERGGMSKRAVAWLSDRMSAVLEENFLGDYQVPNAEPSGSSHSHASAANADDTDATVTEGRTIVGRSDALSIISSSSAVLGGASRSKNLFNLDDDDAAVTTNILPLVTDSDSRRRGSMTWMCSLFRAVVCAESFARGGDLSNIDACLGCPVSLFEPELFDRWETLTPSVHERVVTALVHTANWFRELINAFAMQARDDIEMKAKILQRVNHLVQIEEWLRYCCISSPEIVAIVVPTVRAAVSAASRSKGGPKQSKRRGKKRKSRANEAMSQKLPAVDKENTNDAENTKRKEDENGSEEPEGAIETVEEEGAASKTESTQNAKGTSGKNAVTTVQKLGKAKTRDVWKHLRSALRPLCAEAALVLTYGPVDLCMINSASQTERRETVELSDQANLCVLEDTLENVSIKIGQSKAAVARTFGPCASRRGVETFRAKRLRTRSMTKLMLFFTPLVFPALKAILDKVVVSLRKTAQANVDEDDEDDDMMQDQHLSNVQLLDCSLRLVSAIVRYHNSSVASDPQKKVLLRVVQTFSADPTLENDCEITSANVARNVYEYFEGVASTVGTMTTLKHLLDILAGLASLERLAVTASAESGDTETTSLDSKMSRCAAVCLERDWSNGDTKFKYKADAITRLLDLHLVYAPSPMEVIQYLSTEILPTFCDGGSVQSHPTLTKASLRVYYKALLRGVLHHFKIVTKASKQVTTSEETAGKIISDATKAISSIRSLVSITKKNIGSVHAIAFTTLRTGKSFVEVFIKFLPFIERHFGSSHRDSICKMVKSFQVVTRQMQVLCAHGKMSKSHALAKLVPGVKRCLEEFIFKVKGVLQSAGQMGAFWVGNLKHRNIDGTEVAESSEEEEEEENDDEEEEEEEVDGAAKGSFGPIESQGVVLSTQN